MIANAGIYCKIFFGFHWLKKFSVSVITGNNLSATFSCQYLGKLAIGQPPWYGINNCATLADTKRCSFGACWDRRNPVLFCWNKSWGGWDLRFKGNITIYPCSCSAVSVQGFLSLPLWGGACSAVSQTFLLWLLWSVDISLGRSMPSFPLSI